MKHYMLDIETLALAQDAVVTDVAMTYYDGEKFADQFEVKMDPKQDRTFNYDTMVWRAENNMTFDKSGEGESALDLYVLIAQFLKRNGEHPIFAKGAHFDFAILENLWGKQGPWHYRQPRDLRTLLMFLEYEEPRMKPTHKAIDDCYDQTANLLNAISGKPEFHAFSDWDLYFEMRRQGKFCRHTDDLEGFTHYDGEKI